MEDPRTLRTLELATALVTSGNPNYATRTISDVSAELLGSADGIDHTFGICNCGPDEDEEGGGGGGPEAPKPDAEPTKH